LAPRRDSCTTAIAGLEERDLEYIPGARERSDVVAKATVLKNKDPFVPLLIERKRAETQLFAKEVTVEGRRYIVCRNEAETEKDRRDRQAIVAALQDALRRGEKALIGKAVYRRYLLKRHAVRGESAFEIDAGKLAEAARFDGIFVLRTNAELTPLEAALRYRELLHVEQRFARARPSSKRVQSFIHRTPPLDNAVLPSAGVSCWCQQAGGASPSAAHRGHWVGSKG